VTKLTPEKRQKFLDELADGQSVSAAAQAIHVSRQTLYVHREHDPDFAAEWDSAIESGTDALEDVAVKRAKESSDTLLIFLLKGRRPEKFKDRVSTEHSGQLAVTDPDQRKARIDELLAKRGS
jgi:hypothetical protein